MSHQKLRFQIAESAKKKNEASQLLRRTRKLLADRLQLVSAKHRRGASQAKATRKALQDPEYLKFLEEILEIDSIKSESMISWETRVMLLQAWQSIEAFHRP